MGTTISPVGSEAGSGRTCVGSSSDAPDPCPTVGAGMSAAGWNEASARGSTSSPSYSSASRNSMPTESTLSPHTVIRPERSLSCSSLPAATTSTVRVGWTRTDTRT